MADSQGIGTQQKTVSEPLTTDLSWPLVGAGSF
jgi:hypothetical protein